MAIKNMITQDGYGIEQPLQDLARRPIALANAPTTLDHAAFGTIAVVESSNIPYVAGFTVANSTAWYQIGGSGSGITSITGTSGGAQVGPAVTLSAGTTGFTITGSANTFTLGGTLVVANGGTGATSLTDHGVLVGSGTAAVTPLAVGTTGQVLTGVTGADPVFAAPSQTFDALTISNGVVNAQIIIANGDPVASANKGTIYIKKDATTTTDRLWINTDDGTTWAFFTTSA